LIVPKAIRTWINRIHPETKAKTILLHKGRETAPATRILKSSESHVFEFTPTLVKARSSMPAARFA
jgi:hypothetical protein